MIGDIHGRSDRLAELLDRIPPDIAVFVMGDVCDRGPDTRGVIDLLLARGARGVRGNHEEWLIRWSSGQGFDAFALSRAMGGAATLRSYGVDPSRPSAIAAAWEVVPHAHRAWLATLPIAMALTVGIESYWLVHAGIPTWRSYLGRAAPEVIPWLVAEHPDDLLWPANEPSDLPWLDHPIIMGHIPLERPYSSPGVIAVDTGCGKGEDAPLTAVILPERRFVSSG